MVTTGRAAFALVPAMVIVAVFTGPTVYAAAGAKLTTMFRSGLTTELVFVLIVRVAVLCPAASVTTGGNDT